MRKLLLVVAILVIPASSLLAQDEPWRDRPTHAGYTPDNYFELMPFVGYRYGGTIYADQQDLFRTDVDVESAVNFGVNFAIPVVGGMKVELMVNRQNSHFTNGSGGLFSPDERLGGLSVTYFQGGLLIPFAVSHTAVPYFVFGAGATLLDPAESGASSDVRFSLNGGIGVKIPLHRNMGLRLEGRGYFTSLSNYNNSGHNGHGCGSCYYDYNHDLYQGETNFGLYFRF